MKDMFSMCKLPFERRRRYFVDPKVQGALLLQGFYFWLWPSLTFAFILLIYRVLPAWFSGDSSHGLWYHIHPYLVATTVLFPLTVLHANRFSNRVVGPMVRIRRALNQIAAGEQPSPIVLRQRDFWSDIAERVNEIALQVAEKRELEKMHESEGKETGGKPTASESPAIPGVGNEQWASDSVGLTTSL